jgi:flagellar basal-body rod protein FlgF/flagellar basal-body rod protein FlgG
MDSGLYAACAGVIARTQTLDMAASNLANASTTAFKGQQPTFQTVLQDAGDQVINRYTAAVDNFGVVGGSRTDLRQGTMSATGNSLDVALQGSGFLAVQTNGGVQYTRNGSMRLTSTNQLVTADGSAVLDTTGKAITLPSGDVTIGSNGTISVNGALAGQLQIVEFPADTPLTHTAGSYYTAPAAAAKAATDTTVQQGMLENSNVDSVTAAVNLIGLQRNAEMLTKAMSIFHNDINRMAAEDLPKV